MPLTPDTAAIQERLAAFPLTTYQAVVTITYTYLSQNYSFSMSTIRTSDI